ncbi:S41 family peptidase [Paenibacillus dendritiformis]|uniref:S41 family peptidase n=1 Tax=Paenibacillus dendritiformis TaxID=130049 RepID=UPI00248B51C9|nr:S41 family peptidase [Paenibacillus dendritiformis]WGU92846.1 S41 family peptidase [Paenibacillus dendritiformis]
MKKASLIVLTAIIFLMSAVPAFAKEEESSSHHELMNVRAFTKLYGYVRFFHPSDENTQIDWKRFAIHGVSKVRAAKTKDELTTTLQDLFYPIAPTMNLSKQDNATRLSPPTQAKNLTAWLHEGVKMDFPQMDLLYKSERQQSADLSQIKLMDQFAKVERVLQPGETVVKPIAPGVFAHIPLVLYRDEKGTIGATPKSAQALTQLQQQLSRIDIEKASLDDKNVRLANIVIAWNVLQHFYPYFDVVKVDWEQALTDALQQSLKDQTTDQFVQTMKQMLEKTRDGHSGMYGPMSQISDRAYFPFRIEWIEEQVVISNVKSGIGLKPGDIILNMNGKSATTYFKQLGKYISGTGQWKRYLAATQFLEGTIGKEAKLTVQRGEHTFEISIPYTSKNYNEIDDFIRPVSIDKVDDDIYYVNLTNLTEDMFKKRLHELEQAKGIIFDMRGYPNINHNVLSYLTDAPVQLPQLYVPISVYPDQEKLGFRLEQVSIEPAQPKLKEKIVFLTYGRAISQAEWILGVVEHYRLGEIVGEPTAGANGNVNRMELPGGYNILWTGAKILKQDGSQHHLIGIQPTVPVKRTIKELREGRDIYMEKAIEVINAAKSPR